MPSLLRVAALCLALAAASARAESNWSGGYREGGDGFYISAPEQHFHLNFLGYGQFHVFGLSSDYTGFRADRQFGMSLRRARLELLAAVQRNYEFFVELGTPTVRPFPGYNAFPVGVVVPPVVLPGTGGAAAQQPSDFGLAEARLTAPVFGEWLQLRIGKFIGPFSRENVRSPKNLDVIERSTVINSMNMLPALDTQVGLMLFGRILDGVMNYYLAFFNGNTDATGSGDAINGDKDIQLKFTIQAHKNVTFGLGVDSDFKPPRALSMVDHAFQPIVTGVVQGRRYGFEFDFDLNIEWFNFKTELLGFSFEDSPIGTAGFMNLLYGAFLQFGFQAWGDPTYGLQLVLRYEYASALVNLHTFTNQSVVLGFNIFINQNLKDVVNYIAEMPSTAVSTGPYASAGVKHILINQLQVKF